MNLVKEKVAEMKGIPEEKKLVEALSNTNNSVTTYSYNENWIEILKDF